MEDDIEVDETSTNFLASKSAGISINFHGGSKSTSNLLPWKLVKSYTEICLLPLTCMRVGRNSHGVRSNVIRWTLTECSWKQLEVCDTRGSIWKYIEVYGSLWKLLPTMVVEAAIDGSNGHLHFHHRRKVPSASMEASNNFHGTKCTSINFFHGSESTSINFSHASKSISNSLPWKLVETSMEPDGMEVGGHLRKFRGSSWKFAILVDLSLIHI